MIKSKINNKVKGFLPLFFLLAFFACKKETTEIGANLRQDNGGINSTTVDFQNAICRTVIGDSFRSDNLNANVLGVINDPVFGLRKASVLVQPLLSETGNTELVGKSVDSIKLVLRYDFDQLIGGTQHILMYGDTSSVIELDVYKLNEDIEDTAKYYNDYMPVLGDKIGEYTGNFSLLSTKTVIVDGDTQVSQPELLVTLDNSFGQELMDMDAASFTSNTEFLMALKGLVVVPRNNIVSGNGAIVGIETNVSASGLILYYGDTLTRGFPLSSSSNTINFFESDPGAEIIGQMSGVGHYNTTYTQSVDGSKVFVEVPDLKSIIEMADDIVINEAIITVKIDQSTVSKEYPAPSRMWLQVPDTAGGNVGPNSIPINDLLNNLIPPSSWQGYVIPGYGGEYDGSGYEFRFNRYLQALVKEYKETGKNAFNGFFLSIPSDYPAIPSRAVMDTEVSAGGVKVSVNYSKLN